MSSALDRAARFRGEEMRGVGTFFVVEVDVAGCSSSSEALLLCS